MELKFTKMHGCGNDYIYFNCFEKELDNIEDVAIKLSDRHFGVGGDGIVLICKSDLPNCHAKMRMFNIDGSEGKMCGNAIRCVSKYLYDNKMVTDTVINIETLSGTKVLTLTTDNGLVKTVKVDMEDAILIPKDIPVVSDKDVVVNEPLEIDGKTYNVTCVSMGNPHAIVYCDEIDNLDLTKIGPLFENNKMFPERVNTEFVQVIDETTVKMRVWERGSGETLACGTGACAVAVASVLNGHCKKNCDITVKLLGGDLVINYTDETVFMTGSCDKVFDGVIEV